MIPLDKSLKYMNYMDLHITNAIVKQEPSSDVFPPPAAIRTRYCSTHTAPLYIFLWGHYVITNLNGKFNTILSHLHPPPNHITYFPKTLDIIRHLFIGFLNNRLS